MENLNVPAGYQTVMPYLLVEQAAEFITFMQQVFNAEEVAKVMRNDNSIMHGEVRVGDSTLMFADSSEAYPTQPAGLYVHVANADETYAKALSVGAVSVQEPVDRDYGRSSGVKDPFGNTWWITSVNPLYSTRTTLDS